MSHSKPECVCYFDFSDHGEVKYQHISPNLPFLSDEMLNFGFKKEHAQVLANVELSQDYGSLSTKAMRNIIPFIKELQFKNKAEAYTILDKYYGK